MPVNQLNCSNFRGNEVCFSQLECSQQKDLARVAWKSARLKSHIFAQPWHQAMRSEHSVMFLESIVHRWKTHVKETQLKQMHEENDDRTKQKKLVSQNFCETRMVCEKCVFWNKGSNRMHHCLPQCGASKRLAAQSDEPWTRPSEGCNPSPSICKCDILRQVSDLPFTSSKWFASQ